MFYRSIISCNNGIISVPSEAVIWTEDTQGPVLDYISETAAVSPLYCASWDGGTYAEVVAPPVGWVWKHHFSGWDPETWPK